MPTLQYKLPVLRPAVLHREVLGSDARKLAGDKEEEEVAEEDGMVLLALLEPLASCPLIFFCLGVAAAADSEVQRLVVASRNNMTKQKEGKLILPMRGIPRAFCCPGGSCSSSSSSQVGESMAILR